MREKREKDQNFIDRQKDRKADAQPAPRIEAPTVGFVQVHDSSSSTPFILILFLRFLLIYGLGSQIIASFHPYC